MEGQAIVSGEWKREKYGMDVVGWPNKKDQDRDWEKKKRSQN
jgi:hypothetical protein